MCSGYSQSLVIATYQYAANNRIANIQPLADHLSKHLHRTVEVKSYPTVHQFIEAIRKNEVDIALINTFGYLLLESASDRYQMKPYSVLSVREDAKDNYKTAVIAPSDFNADTLYQLQTLAKETRLLLVAVGSTSGNLVPRLALSAVGLKNPESDFTRVSYAGNHRAAVDSVLSSHDRMVAAIGSTEYFDLLKHPAKAARIKLLWMSPEIPLGPVLLHDRLPADLKKSIALLLTELHHTNSEALNAVKDGWSEAKQAEKYIPFTPGYYSAFTRQLGDKQTMERILKQFAK
jgi:phosphonate transport system substrate-binding protein